MISPLSACLVTTGLRYWHYCCRAADREWSRAYRAGRAEASLRPFLLSSDKSLEGEVERCRRGELGRSCSSIRDLNGDPLSADEVDASFFRAGLYERFADAAQVRFPCCCSLKLVFGSGQNSDLPEMLFQLCGLAIIRES